MNWPTGCSEVIRRRVQLARPDDDAIPLYTSGSTSAPKGVLHRQCAPVIQGFNMADCMAIGPDDRTWTSFPLFWTGGWVTGVAAPLAAGACAVLQEYFDPHAAGALIERERVTSIRQMVYDEHGVVTDAMAAVTSVGHQPAEVCGWGMTETFTIASMLPFDAPAELRTSTNGWPVPGARLRIRDPATGAPVPPGRQARSPSPARC